MTLRAITAAAIAAVSLATVAGCGTKGPSSPADVELAYSVEDAKGIFLIDREGKHRRRLLTPAGTGTDSLPEWSPDGSRLAFVREVADDESHPWVYVVGRDGKGARRLVRGDSAAWLPDGSGLLVQRWPNIFVVTLEAETRLLAHGTGPLGGFKLILSPDGAMVAYLRGEGSSTQPIYASDTRGGPERKVLDVHAAYPGEAAEVDALAWSSNGQALYGVWTRPGYGSLDEDAYATLHEVTLSGSSRVLATGVNQDSGIAVSPSGDRVAFASNDGLEVVDLETGKRRLVLAGAPDSFVDPDWSPDGSTLAYFASESPDLVPSMLETVRADGSSRRQVSAPGEFVDSFSWRPASAAD
jgi:Tol biopolymer transport system component